MCLKDTCQHCQRLDIMKILKVIEALEGRGGKGRGGEGRGGKGGEGRGERISEGYHNKNVYRKWHLWVKSSKKERRVCIYVYRF